MFLKKYCLIILPVIVGVNIINSKSALALENATMQPVNEKQENKQPVVDQSLEYVGQFKLFSVGINLGKRNVLESTFVRGLEREGQAIEFEKWLLPFDDVVKALKISVNTLNDGKLELRSPGLVVRIDPEQLQKDPELGLAFSIEQIQNILGVPTEFNIEQYTIIFNPPWLGVPGKTTRRQEIPVILEGLPTIQSPEFSVTAVGQRINVAGSQSNFSQSIDNVRSQGELTTIGTFLGGSWFIRNQQSNLTNPNTWKLSEAQYFRQTASSAYILGSQQTFWQNQDSSKYWGFTTIQRFGFTSNNTSSQGLTPNQQLQASEVRRTIIGEANPGTLVQLVQGLSNEVVSEILVDSSGVYRFENVVISPSANNNYRVFLYPNGRLAAQPEIREVTFTNLPGQLTKGTSELIFSTGFSGETFQNSSLSNSFNNWRGAIAYRLGATEDLTLGVGLVSDQALLGLAEVFYQPAKVPLKVSLSALIGNTNSNLSNYSAEISYVPSTYFNAVFNSDYLSQRFRVNWQAFKQLSFRLNGNSRENSLSAGMSFFKNSSNFFLFSSLDYGTNNKWRANLNSSLNNLQLNYQKNEISDAAELIYNFSRFSGTGNALVLGYEKYNSTSQADDLVSLNWRYRAQPNAKNGRIPWEFNLGYGIGSNGNGILASASMATLPGLALRLRYEGISAVSDSSNFLIDLSSDLNLQHKFGLGNLNLERLRSEGGLFIQPFIDKNGNNILDKDESIETKDAELLLALNNKPINSWQPDIRNKEIFVKLPPGMYRLDLDPAGYPVDSQPVQSAYAVEVVAGSYTKIQIPFSVSYTVGGIVKNLEGKPVGGVKVEAVPIDKGKKVLAVTNGAGVFFLEKLQQGTYNLLINEQPAQPSTLEINQNSQSFQELNLQQQ